MIPKPGYNLVFLCLTEGGTLAVPPRTAFNFLDALARVFLQKYGKKVKRASAYSLNESFRKHLFSTMHTYNTNPPETGDTRVNALTGKVEDIKAVMEESIANVMARGEKVELLVAKCDDLESQSK